MEDFQPIRLNINGHMFPLDPEDFIASEDDICVILVYNLGDRVVVDDDTIVLGANFLRKYYTVFDLEKERVGIYGQSISAKVNYSQSFMLLGLFLLMIMLTVMLYFYLMRKSEEMKEKVVRATESSKKGKMHRHLTIKI